LVVFFYFQFQGFRVLGVRTYLGKFFPLSAFRQGLAAGLIALYVGLIEFLLEFIKPVTLAMRLFGNIFGGEVALGVITALTIAVLPAAMLLLEGLLNFVQALIFSTLMLMYTIIAVETHGEEHAGRGVRRRAGRPGHRRRDPGPRPQVAEGSGWNCSRSPALPSARRHSRRKRRRRDSRSTSSGSSCRR